MGEKTEADYHLKILVVGERACGKTTLIHRYVKNIFLDGMKMTVGVDFSTKTIEMDGSTYRLQLWDIAGQERFGHMCPMYYREADGAFVVYDVKEPATLELAARWKESLDQNLSDDEFHLPVVLLGNKCDLPHETDKAMLKSFCEKHGFINWFETSAKENTNIEEAVLALVKAISETHTLEPVTPHADIIHPDQAMPPPQSSNGCPCV